MAMLAARPVVAETTDACLHAHEQSQRLRLQGKLRAARAELITCSQNVCPRMVRTECSKWIVEVDAVLPSVVIAGRGPEGQDVSDVRVSVDGQVATERLDGKELSVDPGPHKFRFERAPSAPIEQDVIIREGEKARPLVADFRKQVPASPASQASSASAPGESSSSAPAREEPPRSRPVPTLVYVLGGVGVAAVGGFAAFAISGYSQEQSLQSTCSPNCSKSDTDAIKRKYLYGDILLGVGVVSLGVATVLFLSRPEKAAAVRGGVHVDVTPTVGGAAASAKVVF